MNRLIYFIVPILSFFAVTSGFVDSRVAAHAVSCMTNIRTILGILEMGKMDRKPTPTGPLTLDKGKNIGLKEHLTCSSEQGTRLDYLIQENENHAVVTCPSHGSITDIELFLKTHNSSWEKSKRQLWAFKGEFVLLNILGFGAVFLLLNAYGLVRRRFF